MREHPWNIRRASSKHYQWFRNLADLHELTTAWLKALKIDRAPYLLTRGLSRDVTENLWMLAPLANTEIEPLLDDTTPDDVLARLENTVWAVQAWTLSSLLERTPEGEQAVLGSLLEQTSWKSGRSCAEIRWAVLSEAVKQDLRGLFTAALDSPFSGYPHREGFLMQRATSTEICVESLNCAHRQNYPEVKQVEDLLCNLHSHWMRGYVYYLNSKVSIETTCRKAGCTQRWFQMN